MFAVLKRRLVQ